MLLNVENSQLVLIDLQPKIMGVVQDAAFSFNCALKLAQAAKILSVPVIGTEQNPDRLGKTDEQVSQFFNQTLNKQYFSAVPDGLCEILFKNNAEPKGNARSLPKHIAAAKKQAAQEQKRDSIIVAGWETHICVLQTVIELLEHDVDVWVVADACSSRTLANKDAAFDRMVSLGVELVTTEMVLFEWMRSFKHPAFKSIQQLVK